MSDRVTYSQLRAAAQFEPRAFRALWTVTGMLRKPAEIYTDPSVVAATQDTLRRTRNGPPVEQPSRVQLLAALAP
jgi:hypothetical protein